MCCGVLAAVNGDQIHSGDSLDPNDSFLLSSKSARTSLCGLAASNCWSCFLQIVYLNHVNIDYIWDFTNPKNVPKFEEHVIQTLPRCPPRLYSIWWLICVCQMSGASQESDEELKLFSIRWRNIRGASLWSADSEEAAGYNKEVWSTIFFKDIEEEHTDNLWLHIIRHLVLVASLSLIHLFLLIDII